jgi:hypothetical protein
VLVSSIQKQQRLKEAIERMTDYQKALALWNIPGEKVDKSSPTNATGIPSINSTSMGAGIDGKQSSRKLELVWAKDINLTEEPKIESLWGPFIFPSSMHLLNGSAGAGKTTFFYNFVIKASRGEDFLVS